MVTETNPFHYATVEQGGGAVAPDQIKDSQDYPHTGLIKALQLGMQGNFAIKGATNEFDITQSATDPVLSVSAGKIFQDNLLTSVNSNTFDAADFNNTANNYHLLVAEKTGVGSAQLAIRKFSSSTTNRVPETNARDAIIAVIRYTSDGFGSMEIQYLTTDKIQNHLSISQGGSGDSVYTEAARMVGGTATVDFVTQGGRNLAITPDGAGVLKLDGLNWPTSDGNANEFLKTNGSNQLSFSALPANDAITDADGDTKIQVEESSDEDKIRFDTAGTERMIIDEVGNVGIGTDSPATLLHIKSSGTGEPKVTLENTNADAQEPQLEFKKNGISPANSDDLGIIRFVGDDSNGSAHLYSYIMADSETVTAGAENGRIFFFNSKAGTTREVIGISHDEIVINEAGVDTNFRVEGDGDANLLFVDAGNDRVGIGTNSPSTLLEVTGEITASDVTATSAVTATTALTTNGLLFRTPEVLDNQATPPHSGPISGTVSVIYINDITATTPPAPPNPSPNAVQLPDPATVANTIFTLSNIGGATVAITVVTGEPINDNSTAHRLITTPNQIDLPAGDAITVQAITDQIAPLVNGYYTISS